MLLYQFAPSGELIPQPNTYLVFTYQTPQVLSLGYDEVLNELSLTASQEQQLRRLYQRVTNKTREFDHGIRSGIELPDTILDEHAEFSDQVQRELDRILLPHQLIRLDQLTRRFDLKRRGLLESINARHDEWLDDLQLRPDQLEHIEAIVEGLRMEYVERVADEFEWTLTFLGGIFGNDRFEQLKTLLGLEDAAEPKGVDSSLELLIHQYRSIHESPEGTSQPDRSLVEEYVAVGYYWFLPDGRFSRQRIMSAQQFFPIITSRWDELDILPAQRQDISIAINAMWADEELEAGFRSLHSELESGLISPDEFQRRRQPFAQENEVARIANAMDALLPHQLPTIERELARQVTIRQGLLPTLAANKASAHFRVSSEEQRRIRTAIRERLSELENLSRSMEQRVFDEIAAVLDTDQRRELDRSMGRALEKLPGGPKLLLR